MTKDRNYYRQCDNATILVLAKEGGDELSMVLAERLADAKPHLSQQLPPNCHPP